uniref:(northern house mosquito) hypothetical protein n=1 Tax=Culex pipiens TaxID=7175 RepID=A0A8D8CMX3_CULPI
MPLDADHARIVRRHHDSNGGRDGKAHDGSRPEEVPRRGGEAEEYAARGGFRRCCVCREDAGQAEVLQLRGSWAQESALPEEQRPPQKCFPFPAEEKCPEGERVQSRHVCGHRRERRRHCCKYGYLIKVVSRQRCVGAHVQ